MKSQKKRVDSVISLKPPKGFRLDNTNTDIVGFRGKGNKPKVGVTFTRIPAAPKFRGIKKTKRKTRKKRKR